MKQLLIAIALVIGLSTTANANGIPKNVSEAMGDKDWTLITVNTTMSNNAALGSTTANNFFIFHRPHQSGVALVDVLTCHNTIGKNKSKCYLLKFNH